MIASLFYSLTLVLLLSPAAGGGLLAAPPGDCRVVAAQ
jgi:hypothetical protein